MGVPGFVERAGVGLAATVTGGTGLAAVCGARVFVDEPAFGRASRGFRAVDAVLEFWSAFARTAGLGTGGVPAFGVLA